MQLREKLRLALAAAPVRSAATMPRPLPRTAPRPDLAALPVERRETELGDVYLAEERWPLRYRHGHLPLGDALEANETALARLAPGLHPRELERAAFVDVETTGLAGGTGTLAFLVGVATFEDGSLCLRQYFLAHLGREEAMLAAVSRRLAGCRAIVSFNGRCFDVPLLESRFVLSRLRPPFERLAHLDLLLAARRLYGRQLASCRLGALEEAVLGVRREQDIPGWAVPRLYLDYLRYGAAQPLAGVLRHNRYDVLSLVTLLARMAVVAGADRSDDPQQALTLARWDESRGRLPQAAYLYRQAADSGTDGSVWTAAARGLVRVRRRLGQWSELEADLGAILDRGLPAVCRVEALTELAKIKEHRRRDFRAAEALTREGLLLADIAGLRASSECWHREQLERRLRRLLRRRRDSAV